VTREYQNYIDGAWEQPETPAWFESYNPADTGDCLGRFVESGPADVARAAGAAAAVAQTWGDTPAPQRAALLQRAVSAIEAHKDELARLMTREQGKPLGESTGELKRALDESTFMIGEGYRLYGDTVPSHRSNVWAQTIRVPVGPVAAITPWNFPIITPLRKLMPALIAGNPVVLKPSELTPLIALRLVEIMNDAGLPPGVLNLVTGGRAAGAALVDRPEIRAISFTGSTRAGRAIYTAAAQRLARVQAEMGGKNPVVIWEPTSLAEAVQDIVSAAFLCSGQRCTAISRVIVSRDDAAEVEAALAELIALVRPGNGMAEGVTLGPLVSADLLERVEGYVDRAIAAGARVLTGGQRLTGGDFDKGYFYPVTLLSDVTRGMEIAHEEVFGPVLTIHAVDSFEEALDLANDVEYGLTSSIFTGRLDLAGRFVNGVRSGMVHVNHGTSSEPHMPFGGVKNSAIGQGSIGTTTKDFFTDIKAVYVKYA
jgi:aldehyde dehydrogenase (NAD+)